MAEARNYSRAARRRMVAASKAQQARDAIGELMPGCEIFVLTFGQFSLIDAIVALVEATGPADVTLSTWTAADTDLRIAQRLIESSQIRSMRMIVDRSFIQRQPVYCAAMRRMFGDDSIRACKSHAKFVTIRNERWSLAIRTSMNLNHNPRLENIEISDDSGLCGFLESIADELFAERAPGEYPEDLPTLPGIDWRENPPVEAGSVDLSRLGRVSASRSV